MLTLCISPQGVMHSDLCGGSIIARTFCEILSKLPNDMTLLLDNTRIHHASKCLTKLGLPTVAELARSKWFKLKFVPAYAPHLNPVEFTFNTVRDLLRRKQAWAKDRLE